MPNSRIMVGQHGTHGQIKVDGRGSFENAGAFKQAYIQLIGKGARDFTVDLSTCAALDSTFLGIMVGFGLRAKEAGGHVQITDAANDLIHLFKEVGLDRLFVFDEPRPE
jgi:anti-anti-sigma regulatory factor